MVRQRPPGPPHRRAFQPGQHPGALEPRGPRPVAFGLARALPPRPQPRAGALSRDSRDADHVRTPRVSGIRVGHVDRPQRLHRLQRLRGRLPGGEQHPRRRQGPGRGRPRDALDARRPLLQGRPGAPERPRDVLPARALSAVRERSVRDRLSRRRDRPQRRGPERHGLQPLRRHALLRQQLPLQGAALQLLPVPGLGDAEPQAAAQPGRDGAQPRRDGEVHLLRAAHQPRQDRGRAGRPNRQGQRSPDRLSAGLSGQGDHLRGHQQPG